MKASLRSGVPRSRRTSASSPIAPQFGFPAAATIVGWSRNAVSTRSERNTTGFARTYPVHRREFALTALAPFLQATAVIDWARPEVLDLAHNLARGAANPTAVACRCFEWVRDEILHTADHGLDQVTCSASDVLRERTGFCYAKSHLLAGLLRANEIPAGFVYQRLALDNRGDTFCLHGLNAVWLPEGSWYRIDPRGNRDNLRARFDPPVEVLPFACVVPGEVLYPDIWAEPLALVVDALRHCRTREEFEANLPDTTDVNLHPYRARCVVEFTPAV